MAPTHSALSRRAPKPGFAKPTVVDPATRPEATPRPPYPFTAIVGQDAMRRALLVAAVDPSVGGVLVFGDRGTGKSTAVRALAALLPPMRAVAGCAYSCDPVEAGALCPACAARLAQGLTVKTVPVPVVDLPLGATEDRVVGALDIGRALGAGEKAFEPGLLARANRGFLYIDEVNLLEDHLVDLLLDVAASGVNTVEREGLSLRHPARFVLVGSGNPEEGELRPQLLDRFGLAVQVSTPTDLASRVAIVRRRDAYERDPAGFCRRLGRRGGAARPPDPGGPGAPVRGRGAGRDPGGGGRSLPGARHRRPARRADPDAHRARRREPRRRRDRDPRPPARGRPGLLGPPPAPQSPRRGRVRGADRRAIAEVLG